MAIGSALGSDPYCTMTCSINKVFMIVVFLVGILGSGIFTTIFVHGSLWTAPFRRPKFASDDSLYRHAPGEPDAQPYRGPAPPHPKHGGDDVEEEDGPSVATTAVAVAPASDAASASPAAVVRAAVAAVGDATQSPRATRSPTRTPKSHSQTRSQSRVATAVAEPAAANDGATPTRSSSRPPKSHSQTRSQSRVKASGDGAAGAPAHDGNATSAGVGSSAKGGKQLRRRGAGVNVTETSTRSESKSVKPTHTPKGSPSAPRTPKASLVPKSPKPAKGARLGPFGGLEVNNATDVIGGECSFTACPASDPTGSPNRDKPYQIFNATRPASALPFIHVIVNHRNRFSNLNRLIESLDAATAHDPVLRSCVCIVLVDYASDVPAVQDDPRAVCIPPWNSSLPVPGTLGADLYQEDSVQDAAYGALLGGVAVHTDNATGQLVAPPGARCADTIYGLPTGDALMRLLRRFPGDGLAINATRFFDGYSRAGLLSLGMAAVRTPPASTLVFLVDADMLVSRGWVEEMVDRTWPWKQAYLPVVWSACYGAGADRFPASPEHPSGKETRGWWRTTGTGMVVAYLKDIYRCGGYGTDFVTRGEYGSEDWGLGACPVVVDAHRQ